MSSNCHIGGVIVVVLFIIFIFELSFNYKQHMTNTTEITYNFPIESDSYVNSYQEIAKVPLVFEPARQTENITKAKYVYGGSNITFSRDPRDDIYYAINYVYPDIYVPDSRSRINFLRDHDIP